MSTGAFSLPLTLSQRETVDLTNRTGVVCAVLRKKAASIVSEKETSKEVNKMLKVRTLLTSQFLESH